MEDNKPLSMEQLKGLAAKENTSQQQYKQDREGNTERNVEKNAEHEDLVAQFRAFLQQDEQEKQSQIQVYAEEQAQAPVTLFHLFTELAALKNEVKRESMQVKEAVSTFGGLLDTLKNSNQQLSTELEQRQQQQKQTAFAYQIPVFNELFDLYDSVERTLDSLLSYKPSWWESRSKKGRDFREHTIEGLQITLRRLDKRFKHYFIEHIECVGVSLNPRTMKAVKVMENNEQANGIVLAEIRKGYIRYGETLRLAEVVVNKINTVVDNIDNIK